MDGAWKDRLRTMGMTADSSHADPQHEKLKQRLLLYGGEAVVIHHEPDLENILARGRLVLGKTAIFQPGKRNECHENATAVYQSSGHPIVTGYALSVDGAWRQHSWNVHKKSERIIESTSQWLGYFGFVLDEDECRTFSAENPVKP